MRSFIQKVKQKVAGLMCKTAVAVTNERGEGYVDTGVKILIAVVLGALLLGALYVIMDDVIIANVTAKLTEMFGFTGG